MVNVPGRSKGCQSCRRQKIACSQERPECFICRKAGRICPGYDRDRIFVQFVPPGSGGEKLQAHRGADRQALHSSENKRQETCRSAEDLDLPYTEPDLVPQHPLLLSAYRHQLLGSFLSTYDAHNNIKTFTDKHWLTMVSTQQEMSRALDVSALAFCTAKLGRMTCDRALLKESLRLYVTGLRELQRALYDPKLMYSDDTLGACILLAMYEVFECPSGSSSGYHNHVAGCAKLIQIRGPKAHAHGLGHAIFVTFRFLEALEALTTKRTFLSQPKWKKAPFSAAPRTAINQLLDILLEAPAILAKSDTLDTLPTISDKLRLAIELTDTCNGITKRMRAFYQQLQDTSPCQLFWEVPTAADIPTFSEHETRGLFSTRFCFPDVRVAAVLTLYWSTMTMVLSGLAHLQTLIAALKGLAIQAEEIQSPEPQLSHSPSTSTWASSPDSPRTVDAFALQDVSHGMEFPKMAHNVCKSVEYCMDDTKLDLGLGAVTAPLNIVLDVLNGWPGFHKEKAWIQMSMLRAQSRGMSIIQFIINVPQTG